MANLPSDIWSRILHWLPPMDRQSFKLITRNASSVLTKSQIKTSEIWSIIFPNNRATHQAQELGTDLVLIGRINDIGNKNPKPYLYLVTLPNTPRQKETQILQAIRTERKMERDWKTGACSIDFPQFILNINGIENHGRNIPLPAAEFSQFASGFTDALYYSKDYPQEVLIERQEAPNDYGQDVFISLDDKEYVQLRCPVQI